MKKQYILPVVQIVSVKGRASLLSYSVENFKEQQNVTIGDDKE